MEGDDFRGGIFSYAEFIIEKSHFVESKYEKKHRI